MDRGKSKENIILEIQERFPKAADYRFWQKEGLNCIIGGGEAGIRLQRKGGKEESPKKEIRLQMTTREKGWSS